MACPDGLDPGFGVSPHMARSICLTRSYFGVNASGAAVYASGTGFLVETSAKASIVLTAAHNVYDPQLRRGAKWVSLYFGRIGEASEASRDMRDARYPSEFDDDGSAPPQWDFAAIKVNPLDPGRFKPIPLSLSTATGATKKLLIGYPSEGAYSGKFKPSHAVFQVEPSSPVNYSYPDQPTYAGMSGGPLLNDGAVYGLHIRGGNDHRAIRFAQPVMDRIDRWRHDLR